MSAEHTPGPWMAANMVHGERGGPMTPEEIGEYVANCVRLGDADRFLFVTAGENGAPDICHVGNGPVGAANARLISAAPDLLAISRRWLALDAGAWHVQRHIREKVDLLADTRDAVAKADGQ